MYYRIDDALIDVGSWVMDSIRGADWTALNDKKHTDQWIDELSDRVAGYRGFDRFAEEIDYKSMMGIAIIISLIAYEKCCEEVFKDVDPSELSAKDVTEEAIRTMIGDKMFNSIVEGFAKKDKPV